MQAISKTICALTALCVAGLLPAQDPQGPATGTKPAPLPKISAATRAALDQAKALAGKVKGTRGPVRLQALETAAKAYEDVASQYGPDVAGSAEALFHAGEHWRRHGSLAPAERAYLEAAKRHPSRYEQRAMLLAADMQRRLERKDEALATYQRVVDAAPQTSRAQEARLWHARLLQGMGRLDEAIDGFRAAVETASRPRQVIEACNWLAKALVVKGDLAGAEAAITHADDAVAAAGADDVEAARLKKTLEGMSARKALQRARDKANQAGKDARQLELDRRGRRGLRSH